QLAQCGYNALRRFADSASVPNRKRRQAIGVDVFGRFDQFGKPRQRIARLRIHGIIYFDQDGVVALDDERVVRLKLVRGSHGARSVAKLRRGATERWRLASRLLLPTT